MQKIVINPDIHGRTFWKDSKDLGDKIIFLGDYLDPYTFEHLSKDHAIDNFEEIIDFKTENPDKVILLLGNHDFSYFSTDICDCRCDYDNYERIEDLFKSNKDLFEIFHKEGKYLFSHAGIADKWIDKYFPADSPDKQLELLNDCFKRQMQNPENINDDFLDCMSEVSHFRGGSSFAGSIVWRDVRENISERFGYQIFGHTMLSNPVVTDKWACLDCKRSFILDNDNICELDGTKVEIY